MMSDLEERLREAISASVAGAQPSFNVIDAVRRRHRRRLTRAAAASGVTVMAVVAAAVFLGVPPSGPGHPAPAATRHSPQASGPRGILTDVSCSSPSSCVAVGQHYQPRPPNALIERWNGSQWSIMRGPAPPAHTHADLSGISCSGASSCIAVGASGNSDGLHLRTLVERWNGSQWVIVKSPNPVGATYSFLSSISCPSSSNCWAVGEYFLGGHRQNQNRILIEHWNGFTWKVAASPQPPGSIASYLSAVSCTAESNCVAVGTTRYSHRKGDSYGGPREYTLTEHWNGSSWAIVSSPNPPGPPADGLAGVACTSASDCTAVGAGGRLTPPGSADGASTLVEHWNGSAWSIVRSPSPSANSGLSRVACTSALDCTAVGGFGDLDNPESPSTLIEHWNGSAWSLVTPAASR